MRSTRFGVCSTFRRVIDERAVSLTARQIDVNLITRRERRSFDDADLRYKPVLASADRFE